MAVPGERRATDGNATAEADPASSPFAGSDPIIAWLDVLLKGRPEQQALARTEIAMLLEARGFAADAEEAYWTNVQARAADRRSYERLIDLYRQRGDRLSETLVRRQLDEVFNRPARSQESSAQAPISLARQLTSPMPAPRPPADQPGAASRPGPMPPAVPSAAAQTLRPIRRLRSVSRPADAPERGLDRSSGRAVDDAPNRAPDRPPAPAPDVLPPAQVPAADVLPSAPAPHPADRSAGPRRRAALLPNPGRRARRGWTSGDGRSMLLQPLSQPAVIAALLLACVGAAALTIFVLIVWNWGARSAVADTGPVPARCVDAALRFPGANDPRGSVARAYRQQGVDVEAARPGNPRLTADQAEQVIGGWIGASLLLEHAGQPAPTLPEWLSDEPDRPTLANAILAGRRLDTMLTADEWAELRSWPATSCEGAFAQDPRNAELIRAVERVVAK